MNATSPSFPITWRSVPLRAMFRRVKDVGHVEEEMLSVYRDFGVVRKDGRDDNFNKTAEDRSIYQLVDDGWLVVNRMKAWQGALGVSRLRGIVSGHYICFQPLHLEHSRFLDYLLRSQPYTAEMYRRSRGVRPGQIEIDNDLLSSLRVRLPPVSEQRAIADFLDTETARIDGLLDRKRRLVGLAQERIDAEVMEFVGRSDLARTGEGTRSLPLRRLLAKLDREPDPEALMITAFRDGQVTARSLRRPDGFTDSWTEGARVQGVQIGDVVVHGLDGFAGAIGTSEASGCCSPVYHVCSPSDGGDAHFHGRFLRLLATEQYLSLFAVSTRERAVDFRNWDLFGRIPIPVVPPTEQRRVGDRIRALSPLRVAVQRSAALVAERKQALITAAVTGQLDLARDIAEEAS